MPKSLIEQLPEIVQEGRKEAERILEGLAGKSRVSLYTRELVLPAKASIDRELFRRNETSSSPDFVNRLIYGDNLLAMAALLAGSEDSPSLRGAIDLIYIDPPFDSKADYRTKIILPAIKDDTMVDLEYKPTVLEQFAYSDTWSEGTASYLAMLVPRLFLIRELLSEKGSLYIHLDSHVCHYVKVALDLFSPAICLEAKSYGAVAILITN